MILRPVRQTVIFLRQARCRPISAVLPQAAALGARRHLGPRSQQTRHDSTNTAGASSASFTPSPSFYSSSSSSSTSSVNPSEVSHFNALASTWWDPAGPSRLLHLMNPLRHDFLRACHASQPDPARTTGLRLLDVGCGGGIFAESAARLPSVASVTALDPSAEVLAVARAHARRDPALAAGGGGRLRYVLGGVEALPVPAAAADRFDVVSLFEVVEHVDAPAAFLARCADLVRPGGWLLLSTIARTWASWLTTKVVAEHLLRVVPRGTHDWAKYINEHELRAHFAAKKGWNSPRVMGVVYVPGLGWKEVPGSEKVGNYFFAIRKDAES